MIFDYPFTEEEARTAHEEWGCNCGPTALAFALGVKLDVVRNAIPHFPERRYTSSPMMRVALANLGRTFTAIAIPRQGRDKTHDLMFHERMALVRIQWTGPWIVDGKPQKWGARQTHWIACWSDSHEVWEGGRRLVFDCNGGMRFFGHWTSEIVPLITSTIARADGGWFPTTILRLAAPR